MARDENDTKQLFSRCGTCSRTYGHLLDREFGHTMDAEERALDPLAGGIMNQGHQCGMLWGAALAAGAEAFRRHDDPADAIALAITAAQHIVTSFVQRADTVNCREFTGYRLNTVFGLVGYMLKTMIKGMNNSPCFVLAEQWTPEAIQAAHDGLEGGPDNAAPARSCAAEVVTRMGGSDEEAVMVSGFAGGLGLSGNGCGALSAAIWMRSLAWCREHPGEDPPFFRNPEGKRLLRVFSETTGGEAECRTITGREFATVAEHTASLDGGGCEALIEALAREP